MKLTKPQFRFYSKLTARERVIVSGGAVAAVIFVLIYFVLFPAYDQVKVYPDQIAQQVKLLKRYREVLAQETLRQQSLDATQKHLAELESHLLTARGAAAAQAQLQSMVTELATQSQLQVNRTDFLPKKELSADYERISVQLSAVGAINQITAFLMAAKTLPNYVLTDELHIWNYNAQSESFKKTKQLTASIVISGIIRHE